ncbi:MAG: hypothetical protein K2Z81_17510, partial [Cyanobacteria bacterium]|nr:hypothetical protein [Cyanobacteriota bacterium]
MLYGEQERYLKQKKMERPVVFISPFVLDKDKSNGVVFSKTTIQDGSVNSFPECDIVEFYRENATGNKKYCAARAPFKKVLEQLFLFLVEERNLRPKRWRLNNFPRRTELDVLGSISAGKGLMTTSPQTKAEREKKEMENIVSMPIPDGARLLSSSDARDKESSFEFALTASVEELKQFYLQTLKVGNAVSALTEQGAFLIVESLGAAWALEAWFGPGKVEGESHLKLIKRVNYNTPAVQNAFIKQSDRLSAFEQLFSVSLPQKMKPRGTLTVTRQNASQTFVSPDLPETIVQFFRIQTSGPRTVYSIADQHNPHTIIDMDTGLIVTVNPETTREGTFCTLSRSLNP